MIPFIEGEKTNIVCSKCGKNMTTDFSSQYISLPPKYKLICKCGNIQYAECSKVLHVDANEIKSEQEIPYINAEEARKMFEPHTRADELRKIVYANIREIAPSNNHVIMSVSNFPLETVELVIKELQFKGFLAHRNVTALTIRW